MAIGLKDVENPTPATRSSQTFASDRGRPRLVLRPQSLNSPELRLEQRSTTLGSHAQCSYRLDGLAPVHAVLIVGWRAAVLRAWQGPAMLNGVPAGDSLLQPGDHLRLGHYEWTVESESKRAVQPECPRQSDDELFGILDTLCIQVDTLTESAAKTAHWGDARLQTSIGPVWSPCRKGRRRPCATHGEPSWHRLRDSSESDGEVREPGATARKERHKGQNRKRVARRPSQPRAPQTARANTPEAAAGQVTPLLEQTLSRVAAHLEALHLAMERLVTNRPHEQHTPALPQQPTGYSPTDFDPPQPGVRPQGPPESHEVNHAEPPTFESPQPQSRALTETATHTAVAEWNEGPRHDPLESASEDLNAQHVNAERENSAFTTPRAQDPVACGPSVEEPQEGTAEHEVYEPIQETTSIANRTCTHTSTIVPVETTWDALPSKAGTSDGATGVEPLGYQLRSTPQRDCDAPACEETIQNRSFEPEANGFAGPALTERGDEPPETVDQVLHRLAQAGLWREAPPDTSSESQAESGAFETPKLDSVADQSQADVADEREPSYDQHESPLRGSKPLAPWGPLAIEEQIEESRGTVAETGSGQPRRPEEAAVGSAEEDPELAVQQYMERLLERLRGGSQERPATAQEPSRFAEPSRPSKPVQPNPAVTPPDNDRPYVPMREAPERHANLTAMRELALHSARNALIAHAKRHARESTRRLILYAGLSFVLSGICWAWPDPTWPWLTHLSGSAGLILAATLLLTATFKWMAGRRIAADQ